MQPWNKRRACIAAAVVALGSAGLFVAGCGGKEKDAGHAASTATPCEDELSALCGSPCDATTSCSSGLYCFQGACRADCTPMGGQCSGTCLSDGHCMPASDIANLGGTSGPGGGTAGATGVGGGDTCIQQGVEYESLTSTVVLLVDRSGSMTADFGMNKDRWNTIRDILVDPTAGFVQQLQDKVRFGLALYTGIKPQAADVMMGTPAVAASCPDLIAVAPAFNNYPSIHDVFVANEVGDDTPTAESLGVVTAGLEAFQEIGPKAIVLATDGDPDSCADPGANGTQPPRDASLAAVQAAWMKNISTYVISVGPEATVAHLQQLAEAGRGGAAGAHYYPADDANQLKDAFNSILHGVISCDITLNGTVEAENASKGTVTLGGTVVPYGDANGWVLSAPDTVTLQGEACTHLQIDAPMLGIQFECGTVNIR